MGKGMAASYCAGLRDWQTSLTARLALSILWEAMVSTVAGRGRVCPGRALLASSAAVASYSKPQLHMVHGRLNRYSAWRSQYTVSQLLAAAWAGRWLGMPMLRPVASDSQHKLHMAV